MDGLNQIEAKKSKSNIPQSALPGYQMYSALHKKKNAKENKKDIHTYIQGCSTPHYLVQR